MCNLTINQRCTNRYTTGRSGYGGSSGITAIVLHGLGDSDEAYNTWLQQNINQQIRTNAPKSVHYTIADNGTIAQYVADNDTAWGLNGLHNPQWPLLMPTADHNAPFLHIGFTGASVTVDQVAAASQLICCLAIAHNIAVDDLHVIVAADLDDRETRLPSVPANLIAYAQACLNAGGVQPLPNVVDLTGRVAELEACCTTNTAVINALNAVVSNLTLQLTGIASQISAVTQQASQQATQGATMAGDVAALKSQFLALSALVQQHQECIDTVCPTPTNGPIHYVMHPGSSMTITPNVPVWLNLPYKMKDDFNVVMTGPLWHADLQDPCTYRIDATVRLDPSDYCTGRLVWLDLVACGQTIRLATWTATGGYEAAALTGYTLLVVPPACNDVHLQVGTNDNTTPNKVVSFADIQITCL